MSWYKQTQNAEPFPEITDPAIRDYLTAFSKVDNIAIQIQQIYGALRWEMHAMAKYVGDKPGFESISHIGEEKKEFLDMLNNRLAESETALLSMCGAIYGNANEVGGNHFISELDRLYMKEVSNQLISVSTIEKVIGLNRRIQQEAEKAPPLVSALEAAADEVASTTRRWTPKADQSAISIMERCFKEIATVANYIATALSSWSGEQDELV